MSNDSYLFIPSYQVIFLFFSLQYLSAAYVHLLELLESLLLVISITIHLGGGRSIAETGELAMPWPYW